MSKKEKSYILIGIIALTILLIGGMMDIVNNFEIGSLYMPLKKANNQSYIELSKNANIQRIEINDIINIGSANAIIKWVDNMGEYSDNNSSIVLQLNYKYKKYLFTGDIETKVENELIKQNALEEIDILKVAHHGSNSSTSEKFLNEINLDGANSKINQEELNSEYLESIQTSMFSFFEKTIENIN